MQAGRQTSSACHERGGGGNGWERSKQEGGNDVDRQTERPDDAAAPFTEIETTIERRRAGVIQREKRPRTLWSPAKLLFRLWGTLERGDGARGKMARK